MLIFDSGESYEIIAECYENRYGQMAPGKSEPPVGKSIDHLSLEDNMKRWADYLHSENEHYDLLVLIMKARKETQLVEDIVEELEAQISLLED